MGTSYLTFLMVLAYAFAAPANEQKRETPAAVGVQGTDSKDDLNTAASYNRWGSNPSGYGGYGVTGYGLLDDRYNSYQGGLGGYDSSLGYGGYNSYSGYNGGYPGGYQGNSGYTGYNRGYGYGASGYAGNGGYGGYGGNGGLTSYYGYNSPYNQGANHLGYGYYNRRPGNIYNSGVTPNLVTGYRGYSR